MVNSSLISVPKNLKDGIAVRRLLEQLVAEVERQRLAIIKLGGSG